jgi:hypothetical protein
MDYSTLKDYKAFKGNYKFLVKPILMSTGIFFIISFTLIIFISVDWGIFVFCILFLLSFIFIAFYALLHQRICPQCGNKMSYFDDNEHHIFYYCIDCKVKVDTKFKFTDIPA